MRFVSMCPFQVARGVPLHTSCISSCKLDEVGLNVVVGSSVGRVEGEGEEGALLAVGSKVGSREGSNVGRNVDVGSGVGMAVAVGAEVVEVGVVRASVDLPLPQQKDVKRVKQSASEPLSGAHGV